MSANADFFTSEREAIRQYGDWYARQGYQVSVEPSLRELPEFLRTLGPDMIARRDGENIVVQIKTSSPASFEAIQRLARALEHRAGWELQVVYVDLPDPEWQPPPRLPERKDLLARLDLIGGASEDEDQQRLEFLLLWSIIEAAARHRLSALKIPPTSRISSSALLKMLLTEGIVEDDDYAVLRRGLAARNAIAHGFLNQVVDVSLFAQIRGAAKGLLGTRRKAITSTPSPSVSPRTPGR
jgi:REase_AHJR-like